MFNTLTANDKRYNVASFLDTHYRLLNFINGKLYKVVISLVADAAHSSLNDYEITLENNKNELYEMKFSNATVNKTETTKLESKINKIEKEIIQLREQIPNIPKYCEEIIKFHYNYDLLKEVVLLTGLQLTFMSTW